MVFRSKYLVYYHLHRNHTLVLTESKKVYSFGCEDQGQLGHREESNPSVPLPVRLPQGNYTSDNKQIEDAINLSMKEATCLLIISGTNEPKIRNIFAGENCSFATCSSDEVLTLTH